MSYDYKERKTVAVLFEKLDVGIALNVLGHLAQSVGAYATTDLMGRAELLDASGKVHRGIARYGFIVTKTNASKLRAAVDEGRCLTDVLMIDFPRQMLDTRHDDDLQQSIASANEGSLEYLGAIFFGPSESVDAICRKFSLWS